MEFKSNEAGKCPICNSENLSYGPMELEGILGNSIAFPWYCPDCDTNGKEWYITEFDITISGDGNTANEPEVCPDCGFEIGYGTSYLDNDELYYEYNCTECNGSGREYYTLEFDGHTIDGHEDEKIEIVTEATDSKNDVLKASGKMKEIAVDKKDDDIDGNMTVDVNGKHGNMKSIKVNRDKLLVTPSMAKCLNKKQEDIENRDESEPDIDLEDTISLLDMALSEIPTIGVEDWGKDDELLFLADTKIIFENLKQYEVKIPKYFYDNSGNDDWSNGIDEYLETIKGIDPESGKSDNTYNWGAPLTHDVEFTTYNTKDGCYFKGSIHRAGDVRGNYTTEFLLMFESDDDCFETIYDACSNNCCNDITIDGIDYVIEPHFFNEYVSVYDYTNDISYYDVYCSCKEELQELINERNKEQEVKTTEGVAKTEDAIKNYIDKFKSEDKSQKYAKGTALRDEIVSAWKNKDLKTAYNKWSELYDLFSDGWDKQGNKTPDWNEEQNYRDIYELQSIVDTIEDQCVYDVTDYGKAKEYRKMGYDY